MQNLSEAEGKQILSMKMCLCGKVLGKGGVMASAESR